MNSRRPFHHQPLDIMREAGARLGTYNRKIEYLRRKGGLLPQVDRTRGAMSTSKPHNAPFTVHREDRTVHLNLEFFPIHRQYIQGAHGYWNDAQINVWRPHFKRLTTPGHLLLAFISTQGSVVDGPGDQIGEPTFLIPQALTVDSDWKIEIHGTTSTSPGFVSAFTLAWRYVRDQERTHEPVEVRGSVNAANAERQVGTWLWEIEDGQAPRNISTIKDTFGQHEEVEILPKKKGTVVGGFVVSMFDKNSSPIVSYPDEMAKVSNGTFSATKRQDIVYRLGDGGWSYGAFSDGNQWNIGDGVGVVTGDYWQEVWGAPVKATQVTFVSLFPWVLYAPSNPGGVLTLDEILLDADGNEYNTGLDYTVSGAVNYFLSSSSRYSVQGIDLVGVHKIQGMRFTYLGNTAFPSYGNRDSGWNEILTWYDDPKVGKNVQSADQRNNDIPYHGIFSAGINTFFPPMMYIGQVSNGTIKAEIYNDMFGGAPFSIYGGSCVIPGLTKRLPHIPFPNNDIGQYFAADDGSLTPTIIETVRVTASGEDSVPTNLYASGVRVYIDDEDISQFVFGKPSGVIDNTNWRFDNIDISHWVRSPGQHKLVVTCDEGEADVDTRFEVF